MKKEMEKLYNERKLLVEQLMPIEEKIAMIDEKIKDIRYKCPHKETEEIHLKSLDATLSICQDCGEWF